MSYSSKNTYLAHIDTSHLKRVLKRTVLYMLVVCSASQMSSQTKVSGAQEQDAIQAALHLSQGALAIENNEFINGEVAYRKAIAIEEDKATGSYNLGNAYYKNSKNQEALSRFIAAARVATTKPQRHQAFHNVGNALMNQKEYTGAVEAYKNALRNNPTDDKTRYNLALAKDLLEKNPPQESEDDQDKEQDPQDQQDQQDKKDDQDKEKEPKDNQDPEDKKGDEQEDKKEPQEPKDPKEEQSKQDQQQNQPADGKLSPQQVKNLLESMNNQEKKVQDKINAKKQKGVKIKSEKDW